MCSWIEALVYRAGDLNKIPKEVVILVFKAGETNVKLQSTLFGSIMFTCMVLDVHLTKIDGIIRVENDVDVLYNFDLTVLMNVYWEEIYGNDAHISVPFVASHWLTLVVM